MLKADQLFFVFKIMASLIELRTEIERLKTALASSNEEVERLKQILSDNLPNWEDCASLPHTVDPKFVPEPLTMSKLTKEDIERYSRQLILPELRVGGQEKLKASSALVVGCGGLGCPAAAYLAGAGVGRIGLVDHDTVEVSNLHRQVLHMQSRVGVSKAVSLAASLAGINPSVEVVPYNVALTSSTALAIICQYDIVLDCTDNVATRYLLSDACVLSDLPLVSGSALRWEGQLTVYNFKGGPTYRCLYPEPPPPSAVTNCSDGGVLGAVPGVIGCLQALETVKMLSGMEPCYSGSLFLFDGLDGRGRVVKLRGRRDGAQVTKLIDYEQFCGSSATDKDGEVVLLTPDERVTARQLAEKMGSNSPYLLVDVRPEVEVEMCSIQNAVNLPLARLKEGREEDAALLQREGKSRPIYMICRRGNDSQEGVREVKKLLPEVDVFDMVGGLHAWAKTVDNDFPIY